VIPPSLAAELGEADELKAQRETFKRWEAATKRVGELRQERARAVAADREAEQAFAIGKSRKLPEPTAPPIELYFSIVQRKALTPNDFASLAELEQRLLAFGATGDRSRDRSTGPSRARTSNAYSRGSKRRLPSSPLAACAPPASGRQQQPARRARDPGAHGGRLEQARREELARARGQADERCRGEPALQPARFAQFDHRAGEPDALTRRVELSEQLVERRRAGVRVVLLHRLQEAVERGREELRQLQLERQLARRQLAELVAERVELLVSNPVEIEHRRARRPAEIGARQALLRRPALDSAAALSLAPAAARAAIVASQLGHDTRLTPGSVGTIFGTQRPPG
jgi:hypothetical protein